MAISVDGVSRTGGGIGSRSFSWQAQESVRFFGFLAAVLALTLALFVGFSFYEWAWLGETQLGMRKAPFVTPYYVGRFAAAVLLSVLIASGLYALRGTGSVIDQKRMPSAKRRLAWAMLGLAAACALLFALDARLFNRLALEDKPLEWLSALLPLAASLAFCAAFLLALRAPDRDFRRRMTLALCALLAFALFIIGMEEISWMQRVFAIPTPALFAENQQQEMNLHNMHSIAIGQAHKAVMFAALALLPFIRDMAPQNRFFDAIADFLPSRLIFAVSAPWAAFNYNEWNFLASQMYVTLTLAILACYVKAAWDRGDGREMALFGATAAFIVIAQPLFLIYGDRFLRMWDASEYVELFIALGLTFYTAETMTRLAARYGAREGRRRAEASTSRRV